MLKNPTEKHLASIARQLYARGYKVDWNNLSEPIFARAFYHPPGFSRCCGS
jgi:hypothetical protein